MSDQNADPLHRALVRHKPATVKLFVGDECTRTITANGKKKQWEQIEMVVAKLQWERLEMYAKDGSILDVIEIEPEPPQLELAASGGDRDAKMLLMLAQVQNQAWRTIMDHRSREQSAAMQMMTTAMAEMTAAVHGLVQVHNLQIAGLRQFYQTISKGGAQAPARDDMSEAIELAKLILPKALTKGDGDEKATNGHTKEKAQ